MWKYAELLPLGDPSHILTLGEGNTPVCELGRNLYLKLEQLNPTGSYKDRFASCAVSCMQEQDKRVCLATSSGNTGSALAAYCARAGIPCEVFLIETTPAGKTVQMLAYGAKLRRVRGFGLSAEVTEQVMDLLRERADKQGAALQISAFTYSPDGMDGVKSIAYELADSLGEIDDVFVPVGGGGLLTAIFRGFSDFLNAGKIRQLPRIHAVQPEGCATVTKPLLRGESKAVAVQCTSMISGLQVPSLIDAQAALEAVRNTQGTGQTLSDSAIYSAQRDLVQQGIYCEPAGATAYAGYVQALEQEILTPSQRSVCIVTGHGFKDLESVERIGSGSQIEEIDLQDLLSGDSAEAPPASSGSGFSPSP